MNRAIAILGVGNLLRSDDGVGPQAAQALSLAPPPGSRVADVGTDFLSAIPFLEAAQRVLIIDAVHGGRAPGAIYDLRESELAPRSGPLAAHALTLLDVRDLMAPGSSWPEIRILGVEPAVLDYGLQLSPPVAAALRRIMALTYEIVAVWCDRTELACTREE